MKEGVLVLKDLDLLSVENSFSGPSMNDSGEKAQMDNLIR